MKLKRQHIEREMCNWPKGTETTKTNENATERHSGHHRSIIYLSLQHNKTTKKERS